MLAWLHRSRPALAAAAALTCLGGCPRADQADLDHPRDATTTTTTETSPAPEGADLPATACGVDTRFVDYAWIPPDARLTTAIERSLASDELGAALAQLTALADDPASRLPIVAALDYRNLGFQLAALDRLLASLALDPAEVVELLSPTGDSVWIWPTDCPREAIAARVLERHGMIMRVDLDHPSQRRALGERERLPFDLMTLGDRHVAMTLAGRGAPVGAWLDGPLGSTSASLDPDPDRAPPGEVLAEIPAAPIRSVASGEALLTPGAALSPAPPSTPRLHRLRATATAATLEPPP